MVKARRYTVIDGHKVYEDEQPKLSAPKAYFTEEKVVRKAGTKKKAKRVRK